MALIIRTGAHARKTYHPRDIYLNRIAYMAHTCRRLLNSEDSFLVEASDAMNEGTASLSAITFAMPASRTKSADVTETYIQDASEIITEKPRDVDENVDEDVAGDVDGTDSKGEGEGPFNEQYDAETMVDADKLQMKTLRPTTSAHDDWLHRGPYLHDMAFHTYVEYCDRVRLPRKAPADEQLFVFEPHYALSKSYGNGT